MLRRLALTTFLAAAGVVGAGGAPPASGATVACTKKAVSDVLRAEVPTFAETEMTFGGLGDRRCADFTGDGTRDVLYTIFSGGTGGAFVWGLIAADGAEPKVVTTGGGGSKLAIDRLGSRPQILNPIYRRGDGNCCPSGGARIRTFRWNGTRLVLASTRKVRRAPARFYR